MSQYSSGPMDVGPTRTPGRTDVDVTMISPFDRVRWGPILAGLFVALSLIVLLSVLGLAIGLSTYDVNEAGRGHALGSGIWGIITMILAFFLGGWIASRAAMVRGWPSYGLLQGFLVWAVAIPLFIYFLAGAVGNMMGSAAQVAATDRAGQPIRAYIGQGDQGATGEQAMSPEDRQQALQAGRRTAWTTFLSLVLGLGAAAAGGYLGSTGREERRDDRYGREGRTTGTSTPPPTV